VAIHRKTGGVFSEGLGTSRKLLLQCRGTVVRSVWKRGRPVWTRLLRPCNRDRRERFCVIPNGVAFRAMVLGQQARCLKMPDTFLGDTDIFNDISTTAYLNWLQAVQPTAATHEFGAFILMVSSVPLNCFFRSTSAKMLTQCGFYVLTSEISVISGRSG
jgi:hypothetical protein